VLNLVITVGHTYPGMKRDPTTAPVKGELANVLMVKLINNSLISF